MGNVWAHYLFSKKGEFPSGSVMGEHLGSNGEILKEESPEIPQEIPNMTHTSYSHVFQNAAMSKNLRDRLAKYVAKT